jgi:hypothetical protein
LGSCEDNPDFIGGDLLPSGDNFHVLFDSTEIIYGYGIPADSIPSGYKELYLIGNVVDPFFGISSADVITTISPSVNSRGFGPEPYADSVILYLAIDERLGEGAFPMQLDLYELTEPMDLDSVYYSNTDMSGRYNPEKLGSVYVSSGDTTVQIFITEPEFITRFMNAHDTIYKNAEYLQDFMNGFYFRSADALDQGSMVRIDFDDTKNYLYFYYRNDTVQDQKQYFSLESYDNGRVNMYHHDPAGYPIDEYLRNGSDNDSLIFVQSLAGVSSIISFPELAHWGDSTEIAINEAKLIIPLADTLISMQNLEYLPDYLNMYLVLKDSGYQQTYDYLLDEDGFGGQYDAASLSYSFDIKVHLQCLIAGSIENLDMILTPGNTTMSITRGVLYGWNQDPAKRIRLEIIYTRL